MDMKPEDQIKALAELDGWKPHPKYENVMCRGTSEAHIESANLQQYRTSYDAIIPLIQKQNDNVRMMFLAKICNTYSDIIGCDPEDCSSGWALLALPRKDLCEALLRATNRWTE